jgi:hypothetical protein
LTDFAHLKFINDLISGTTTLNSAAPLGYDAAISPTNDQLATVRYVLSVVSGGSVYFDQQTLSAQTSGEALAVNDIVYFKASDARWYKADADLTTTFSNLRLGVNKTVAGAAGVTIQVAISGPVTGFSALSAGSAYYLSNTAGAISTSAGTFGIFIGYALTTTSIIFDPELNAALAGSQGTPNSTNKYITQDNTSAADTDQSQTSQDTSKAVGEADATLKQNKLAQSFIPTKTKIRGVKLYKAADTGTFTGTVTVSLQADTTGSPSGSSLATVTLTNNQYESQAVGEFSAIFSSEYASVAPGSLYWIVIETSTSDNSNHPNLGAIAAGGYSSGSVKFKNTTDGWTSIATIDLYFKTINGVNSQIVKTNSSGKIDVAELDFSAMGLEYGGALYPTYAKTYYAYQIPVLGTNAAPVTGSLSLSAAATVSAGYVQHTSTSTSKAYASNAFYTTSAAELAFSDAPTIVADFWASVSTASIDTIMGFISNASSLTITYNQTAQDAIAFTTHNNALYAHTSNGATSTTTALTGVTLTNFNNYRIVADLTADTASFYVNGILVATQSTNFPDGGTVDFLIGRSGTATIVHSAPILARNMLL